LSEQPENDRKARVFIAMVEAQNLQLSLIDAQLLAMQRFRRFAEIVLLRQPQLALFDKIEVCSHLHHAPLPLSSHGLLRDVRRPPSRSAKS